MRLRGPVFERRSAKKPAVSESSDSEDEGGVEKVPTTSNYRCFQTNDANGKGQTDSAVDIIMLDLDEDQNRQDSSKSILERAEDTAAKVALPESKKQQPPKGADINFAARLQNAKPQTQRAAKRQRAIERSKTTGSGWFDMRAPELTDERRADLELLQMRNTLDPLAFYRRPDRDVLPKFFQVGRVVDAPIDFYASRIPKKQRKQTMVDELLADADFQAKQKKKFKMLEEKRRSRQRGAFQKGKKSKTGGGGKK